MDTTFPNVLINGSLIYSPKPIEGNLEYTILNVLAVNEECKNPLNVAEFWWKVEMRRKLKPYLIQTYIPTTMVVMVSWASFLIPFDSYPGRAGLLAGLVLCLINILLNVLTRSPYKGGPDQLSMWLVICICMVGVTFMEYCVVLFYMRHRKKQVDQMNQKLLEKRNSAEDDGDKKQKKTANDMLDGISLIVVPILFMLVALIYFFASYKFESVDAGVAREAKSRFKEMCSKLW